MDNNNIDLKAMMNTLLQNAQKIQENMRHQSDKIVTGQAGGDLVIVDVNLKMQITRLALAPTLFEEKPEVISELIMGAVNQALQNAGQMVKQEMMEATKQMGGGNFGF
ncbi:YbaB/EbfC family nucleoid-associated protein [Candidatus Berkiella aquae]|uniref:Nucleoid-associated protein n=1 Tax=Candidatus Berkiella aquae TaxID=295108 RepID=A0A0Q9YU20_9GAMM|nr:YbaB/EbfC family nucleoid-associated protein [Candidatus Berkiella aquae]MCS5712283.1 YbaB/EbfC family nucleoid-associated protein [Candidatus Berkiella aquae]